MDGDAEAIDFLEEMAETGSGLPVRLVTALRHGPNWDGDGIAEFISLRDRGAAAGAAVSSRCSSTA